MAGRMLVCDSCSEFSVDGFDLVRTYYTLSGDVSK